MIGLNDIRRYIVDHRKTVDMVMLTRQQHQIFRWLRRNQPALTSRIAKEFGLSAQHASGVMDGLHRKGYVDRLEQPQESGGYEYEYTSQID